MPAIYAGTPAAERHARAAALLDRLGPQQWPFPAGADAGRARLYTERTFATADGRARFVVPVTTTTAEKIDASLYEMRDYIKGQVHARADLVGADYRAARTEILVLFGLSGVGTLLALACLLAFALGMVVFTVIMGNAFAAFPVFLLWIFLSWLIILFGVELSRGLVMQDEVFGPVAGIMKVSSDAEAIRLTESMPNWSPGKTAGKPVKSYFNLPVVFKLQ